MRAKGYGAYRGRPRWKTVLKIVLVTLLLLVVLAAALMVYLERYLVVTGEGVRLELPFFQNQEQEQVSPSPTPGQSEPVVVVTPTPVPTPTVLEPVSLELTSLLAGTAAQETAAAGGNAALFDMKSDSGALAYGSSVERAVSGGLSADDPTLNGAITSALEEEGLYAIARVSCFKDNDLSNEDRSLAVTTNSGYRWTDPEGIRWVSPTSAEVRDYITEVCVELAELGFDEIMLDNAGYPPEGNLHYIRKGEAYDESAFSTVIGGFYEQVAAALEPYDTVLSIVTTPEALAGTDTVTGQTEENLYAHTAHLWLYTGEGQYAMLANP